ncbi:MAG: hypothetical protein U1E27_06845, partial [Kiritimatiellia bacterium]|nr:hypothetical protein [Kiritimatiellia bacterium]
TLIRRVEEFHSAAKQFGSVQQAAENAGLPVLPVEGFSATSSAKTDETIPAEALMSGILHLQNGAISDPVQNGNDGWIVAQVIRREPAPLSDVEALVPDVTGMLYRERSRQVFQDLQSYLLRPERFTNLRPAKPDEENEEI